MQLSLNPLFHNKSKHIEIQYHYIHDMVQRDVVKLQYASTDDQTADILTKPLRRIKFAYFCERFGVVENISLSKRDAFSSTPSILRKYSNFIPRRGLVRTSVV